MNENQLKAYVILIYMGVVTAVVLLIIDFKLKSDTVKMLGGNPLGPGQDNQASVWNGVRYSRDPVSVVPDSRFAPRMEEGTDNHVPSNQVWTTEAGPELGDGESNSGVPEDDQSI